MVHPIRRLDLGHLVRPGSETVDGRPQVVPVLAYLVRHERGLLLLDTGIGADPEVDHHYRPGRHDLREALGRAGTDLDEITIVVNCHLHFDHSGGNPRFPGRPILVQRTELARARGPDYTLPDLVDFPGATYEELDGEAEVFPGVWIVPTPGHTAGHQAIVVRRADGTVVLAGQAHETTADFAADHEALAAGRSTYAPWLPRLLEFDPRQVRFAHDASTWTPG
jgi:N-acyl homoserine lactone hydrolase